MKISDLNASEIISKIAQKELSSVEVAENLIEQTKTWAHINSLINFDEEKFLNSAIEADRKLASGEKIGQLHGVPIVVKDNIDVEGFDEIIVETLDWGKYNPTVVSVEMLQEDIESIIESKIYRILKSFDYTFISFLGFTAMFVKNHSKH